MNQQRWNLWISGRVQGVSYRASARQTADRLGVTGYAKNLPDGRVEVVAEGPEESLQAFREWCRHGSPSAVVDQVDCEKSSPKGEFHNFSVR